MRKNQRCSIRQRDPNGSNENFGLPDPPARQACFGVHGIDASSKPFSVQRATGQYESFMETPRGPELIRFGDFDHSKARRPYLHTHNDGESRMTQLSLRFAQRIPLLAPAADAATSRVYGSCAALIELAGKGRYFWRASLLGLYTCRDRDPLEISLITALSSSLRKGSMLCIREVAMCTVGEILATTRGSRKACVESVVAAAKAVASHMHKW